MFILSFLSFFDIISWNFEQKLNRFICKKILWIFWHPWGSCRCILEQGVNLTFKLDD